MLSSKRKIQTQFLFPRLFQNRMIGLYTLFLCIWDTMLEGMRNHGSGCSGGEVKSLIFSYIPLCQIHLEFCKEFKEGKKILVAWWMPKKR